jgi:hypothetical protein
MFPGEQNHPWFRNHWRSPSPVPTHRGNKWNPCLFKFTNIYTPQTLSVTITRDLSTVCNGYHLAPVWSNGCHQPPTTRHCQAWNYTTRPESSLLLKPKAFEKRTSFHMTPVCWACDFASLGPRFLNCRMGIYWELITNGFLSRCLAQTAPSVELCNCD